MHIFIRIQYILSECQYFQTSAEVQNTSWSPNTYWCVLFYFFLSFTIKIVKTVYKLDSHFWFQVYSLPENSPLNVPPRYIPPRNVPPGHVFRQLRYFGLQLASLALGLRTLVGTGSRQRHILHSEASLEGNVLGWNLPGGIYRSPDIQN